MAHICSQAQRGYSVSELCCHTVFATQLAALHLTCSWQSMAMWCCCRCYDIRVMHHAITAVSFVSHVICVSCHIYSQPTFTHRRRNQIEQPASPSLLCILAGFSCLISLIRLSSLAALPLLVHSPNLLQSQHNLTKARAVDQLIMCWLLRKL